jgi:DNA-directed RNA polymerase specialized sigma24 family protein
VTDIAPTLGGAGDAVNASDRTQFDEFMASRWPGLVRLAFGLTGDRWLAEDLAQTALASAYAPGCRVTQLSLRFARYATTITTLPPAK